MLVSRRRDTRRMRLVWFLGQVVFVALCIFLYFRIRNITAGSRELAVAHAQHVVNLERSLGIYVEDSLQHPFLSSHALASFANDVYIYGHWPVIITTMIWLAWRHRTVFLRFRDGMIVSGLLGMVVFVTYPVAPPRLADLGLVDTITKDNAAYRVLQPAQFTNQFAAIPSLHAGWDLLVGIALVSASTSAVVKAIGYILPVLMMISVVATANHYIVDVAAGVSIVLVAHAAALALGRRRAHSARRQSQRVGLLASRSG